MHMNQSCYYSIKLRSSGQHFYNIVSFQLRTIRLPHKSEIQVSNWNNQQVTLYDKTHHKIMSGLQTLL